MDRLLLFIIGLAAGYSVAAGIFAFVTTIGVVTRLAAFTKTAKNTMLYEDMVLLGGIFGNYIYFYNSSLPLNQLLLGICGIFLGIFVGCLATALAEVLQVFPIIVHRFRLRYGLPFAILMFGLGKAIGSLYQLYLAER